MVGGDTSGFSCYCGARRDYNPDTVWEHLRYKIEEHHHMIHDPSEGYRKVIQGSCVVGVLFSEYKECGGDVSRCVPMHDSLVPGLDPIVLIRLPVVRDWRGKVQRNTYVPVDISHLTKRLAHPTITSPERLQVMAQLGNIKGNMAAYRESIGRAPHHPSRASFKKYILRQDDRAPNVKPPDTYICGHCLAAGQHLKEHCPKMEQDPTWVSVAKRKPPTGIPRFKIREARSEAEKATAPFVDREGIFWVWRR